jgi:hypothetical protein
VDEKEGFVSKEEDDEEGDETNEISNSFVNNFLQPPNTILK